MFFVVRSNDIFNFPLGLIKYIVIVVIVTCEVRSIISRSPSLDTADGYNRHVLNWTYFVCSTRINVHISVSGCHCRIDNDMPFVTDKNDTSEEII